MRDLRKYWQEVRALAAKLPEFVWLRSLAGEVMTEVAAQIAAQFLLGKTHRLASDEEIAEHRAREQRIKREAAEADRKRRGVAIVEVK